MSALNIASSPPDSDASFQQSEGQLPANYEHAPSENAPTGSATETDAMDDEYNSEQMDSNDTFRVNKSFTVIAGNPEFAVPKRSHRRNYQSLGSGPKMRHIKKKDGEPLWREDIQFDFLHHVFWDETPAFTDSYKGTKGNTFADIYIGAMARSTKCSKVLRDKLLTDRASALHMAMVCLLVNVGRMNTTLNFFPEMKAQLRTYHPIPSLQSQNDQGDYKQLQDAPRLKSILKGACEGKDEPATLDAMITNMKSPHTNPINALFILTTYYYKVRNMFFPKGIDMFHLITEKQFSSASRARALLWLLYAYLETDLSREQLLDNPFAKPLAGETDYVNTGLQIPPLITLSPEELAAENVDTPEEQEYGEHMKAVRRFYLEEGQNVTVLPQELQARLLKSKKQRSSESLEDQMSMFSAASGITLKNLKKDDLKNHPKKRIPLLKPGKRSLREYSEICKDTDQKKAGAKVKTILRGRARQKDNLRQQRLFEEFERLLEAHDKQMAVKRHKEGSLVRYWNRINDLDDIYDSDIDIKFEKKKSAAAEASNPTTGRSRRRTAAQPDIASLDSIDFSQRTEEIRAAKKASGLDSLPGDFGEEQHSIARSLRKSFRWIHKWYRSDDQSKFRSFGSHEDEEEEEDEDDDENDNENEEDENENDNENENEEEEEDVGEDTEMADVTQEL